MIGSPTSRRRSRIGCAVGVLLAGTLGSAAPPRPLPGPRSEGDAPTDDPAAVNGACEACHADVAAEWRGSLHRAAWDDPVFQTAYALEPIPFCRGCHAPEADPAHVPPEGARRVGVGCITCHVQAGEIVGTVAHSGGAHAVRADPRLATTAACAGCHQFDFLVPQASPMQGTIDEHRASPYASMACQDCHMPAAVDAEGLVGRRHDFRVLGNPDLLRSAIVASAERAGERTLLLSLRTGRVGHAFPTGDMFRRLEVRARALGSGAPTAAAVVLARRFERLEIGGERTQIGDDRLPASGAPRDVSLTFNAPITDREVRWEVAYQRMGGSMAAAFGVDPGSDEVIVAQGSVSPRSSERATAPEEPR